MSAARIIAIVVATFASLAGGVYLSSSSACKAPCRLDGTYPRVAILGQREKVPGVPEQNSSASRRESVIERAGPPPPAVVAQPGRPPVMEPRPAPPRPSVGMRRDLPDPPIGRRDERWKEPMLRAPGIR